MTFAAAVRVSSSWFALRHRVGVGAVTLAAASVLVACGGGDQVKEFNPSKIVSFGDEASVLTSKDANGAELGVQGLKYTVNQLVVARGLAWPLLSAQWAVTPALPAGTLFNVRFRLPGTDTEAGLVPPTASGDPAVFHDNRAIERTFNLDVKYKLTATGADEPTVSSAVVAYQYVYDCTENRLWIQILANNYGLGFASGDSACPGDTRGGAVSHAQANAKVADVAAQVAAHRGELDSNTLVTMLAGRNDIFDELSKVVNGTVSEASAKANMKARGAALAAVVNDIIKTGARVILVNLPDQGYTPYGRSLGKSALLFDLTESFNQGLTGTDGIVNDGRKIALVRFDNYFKRIKDDIRNDGQFVNITDSVCSFGLGLDVAATVITDTGMGYGLYCNTETLKAGVNELQYFWSDAINLSPGAHFRLGSLAYNQARDNTL